MDYNKFSLQKTGEKVVLFLIFLFQNTCDGIESQTSLPAMASTARASTVRDMRSLGKCTASDAWLLGDEEKMDLVYGLQTICSTLVSCETKNETYGDLGPIPSTKLDWPG